MNHMILEAIVLRIQGFVLSQSGFQIVPIACEHFHSKYFTGGRLI